MKSSSPLTRINRFDGGLKTNVPKTDLPMNYTGSMNNFEINDLGKLQVRKGYREISGSITANPIEVISRYYRKNGSKIWIAAAGTKVYGHTGATTTVPLTYKQAPLVASFVSGYDTTHIPPCGGLTGNPYILMGTQVGVFSFPECTQISITALDQANPGGTGKYKLDTGAWSGFPAGAVNYWNQDGLSVQAHKIYASPYNDGKCFRLQGPNAQMWIDYSPTNWLEYSIRFDSSDPSINAFVGLSLRYRIIDNTPIPPGTPPPAPTYSYIQLGAYLNSPNLILATNNGGVITVLANTGIPLPTNRYLNIEVMPVNDGPTSRPKILIRDPDTRAVVFRGEGLIPAGENTAMEWYSVHDQVTLASIGYNGASPILWVDNIRENGTIMWGGTSLAGWTTSGAVGVNYADWTTPRHYIVVDSFTYSSYAGWTESTGTYPSADYGVLGFALLNDTLYSATNKDVLHKYTTSLALVTGTGTMPIGGHLLAYEGRLWCAGDTTDPSRLRWSAIDSGSNWDTGAGAGYWYLAGKDAGGECTGLTVWDSRLWYFSRSKTIAVSVVGTPGQWGRSIIHSRIGCISPRTVTPTKNAILFYGPGGIYAYGTIPGLNTPDGSDLLWVSENIQNQLDTIDPQYLNKCCAAFYKDRYWLSVPLNGANHNNTIFVYKFPELGSNKPGAWMKFTGLNISDFEVTEGTEYGLYGGDSTKGRIYQLDVGTTDNKNMIPFQYEFPPIAVNGFESIKVLARVILAAESATPQSVSVHITSDDVTSPVQTTVVNANTRTIPLRLLITGRGRAFTTNISGSGNSDLLALSEFIYVWRTNRFR